ncbi:MAG: ribosome recycling factor [Paludibacteraceae bacterium]|nr:ribosome recycling factor [Paludibacteraceae bacterium]
MNNKTINEIFDETKQKMNGHTMLFYFHLSNLCITADPMALLSATVKIEGQDLNLEDVASVSIPNDKQFSILPKDKDYLVPITKAIKLEHPEFKLEEKEEKDEISGENNIVIYYTMPEMNQERHDICMELIKADFDATNTKLEAIFSQGSAKVALKMANASEENMQLAKDKLQEIYDWHTDTLKKLKEEKEKEVEEAFQAYQTGEQEESKATEEKQVAEGIDQVFSMDMSSIVE